MLTFRRPHASEEWYKQETNQQCSATYKKPIPCG